MTNIFLIVKWCWVWWDKVSKGRFLWFENFDNIVVSKLIITKTNSKYFIGYLDEFIGPVALTLPRMSGYVKTSKVKDGIKEITSTKIMSFRIIYEKLLEK